MGLLLLIIVVVVVEDDDEEEGVVVRGVVIDVLLVIALSVVFRTVVVIVGKIDAISLNRSSPLTELLPASVVAVLVKMSPPPLAIAAGDSN